MGYSRQPFLGRFRTIGLWTLSGSAVFIAVFGVYVFSNNWNDESTSVDDSSRKPAEISSYAKVVETIPEDEAESTRKIKNFIEAELVAKYPAGVRPAHRDVHLKAHGCIHATFRVNNERLPPDLRVGVFAQNKEFPAWIRFSNGASSIGPDRNPGPRGMAIKLMGVAGAKILPNERTAQTQDFLMVNGADFFIENPSNYLKMITGSSAGFFATHLHDLERITAIVTKIVANPLSIRYFSQTPYLLGPTAIKFSAVPCSKAGMKKVDRSQPDFLRLAMAANLAEGGACFNFMVQLQSDPENMPIEDSTVHWEEKRSPFIPVAQLQIPAQKFDSPEQMEFCENLSFTPWHSLPEHRPLGGINRIRKVVYDAISKRRHELNEVVRAEPTESSPRTEN
jgi:hypothetical protein